ncbi:MAG: GatB/YqeY domain-containing protein [Planctomycetota bacterium]|jgi:uncharacterized protein YqeY
MTSLEMRLKDDVKAAMKQGAREELEVLRMVLSDAKNVAIASGGERSGLSDEVMLGVLRKAVKTRTESAAMYAKGGRKDLEDKEKAQIEIVRRYLPAEVSEAEIEVVVDTVIVSLGAESKADMGRVMKEAMARLAGRAEGSSVSRIVASRLT